VAIVSVSRFVRGSKSFLVSRRGPKVQERSNL
jgi:hypothetical protein